jgi:serine/threonine protein kinase
MSTGEPGNPVPMIRSPGATLGSRYTLQHKIGSGGYSEVWQAQDAVLDRPVAIKLLHPEYAESGEALQRFRTEAQLAGRLSDANVARVYDFCDTGWPGPPFLVMELIDGPTLADVLRGGPLGPARTMDILSQAASGLNAAHSAGLVHRDIKPSNIMMAPGNVVKIMDFGLSHSLASAPNHAHGHGRRHAVVHGSGTIIRRASHAGERPVLARCRRLRVPGRLGAVFWHAA